jgi:Rrf2 family transcriptional regulator, iron-sulfur cluster assembly transcription factor
MLSLSQTTGYAILALTYLAQRKGEYVLAQTISRKTGIRKPYLSKMLHSLAMKGLIQSKRGYRGGLVLSRPPEDISLLDVIRAVEGTGDDGRCMLGLPVCSSERPCAMHSFWIKESERIEKRLSKTTLSQVIHSVHGGWGL